MVPRGFSFGPWPATKSPFKPPPAVPQDPSCSATCSWPRNPLRLPRIPLLSWISKTLDIKTPNHASWLAACLFKHPFSIITSRKKNNRGNDELLSRLLFLRVFPQWQQHTKTTQQLQSKGLVIAILVFIVDPHGRERYEGVLAQSYQNCRALSRKFPRILVLHCILQTAFFLETIFANWQKKKTHTHKRKHPHAVCLLGEFGQGGLNFRSQRTESRSVLFHGETSSESSFHIPCCPYHTYWPPQSRSRACQAPLLYQGSGICSQLHWPIWRRSRCL